MLYSEIKKTLERMKIYQDVYYNEDSLYSTGKISSCLNKYLQSCVKFSTGKIVNGQPDWSGFGVIVSPTNGRTIDQEYTGQQGVGAPIGTTFTKETGGADEAADITNVENGVRVYRVGDKFFDIATFQNANLLPDGSDGITNDLLMNILSTIKFTK